MTTAVLETADALPPFVRIEPVGRGTLEPAPALMRYSLFCRLVDELPPATELHLHGSAEPLAHPRFFDMVAYATARGLSVSTATHLATFSEQRALECVKSGLHRMDVLLDDTCPGSDPCGTQLRLRRVRRHISYLTTMRKELCIATPEIRVALPSSHIAVPGLADVLQLCREFGIEILDQPPEYDRPALGAYVGYSGDAGPCPRLDSNERISFGNMGEEGVLAVWNSDDYRRFRTAPASGAGRI